MQRQSFIIFWLLAICALQAFAGVADRPFRVSADKQVIFSPGNLQFKAAQGTHQCADGTTQPGTWRFAEHQYDFVGSDNEQISATYDGWIDLFGWGSSGWSEGVKAYQPWATSTVNDDYYLEETGACMTGDFAFADWGVYNEINNDSPDTWRTLGKDEWHYLFCGRENAQNLFAMGTVNGVQGLIILPDGWETQAEMAFTPSTQNGLEWHSSRYENTNEGDRYQDNVYTATQWTLMESFGAVFLPVTGYRTGSTFDHANNYTDGWGHYWSSTAEGTLAYRVNFSKDYLNPLYKNIRNRGFAVRLVKDHTPSPSEYEGEINLLEDPEYKLSGNHSKASKFIQDGQLLILRGDKTFNAIGTQVK